MSAPARLRQRTLVHARTVAAPPDEVYRLVADATNWPVVFPATVHVQPLPHSAAGERIRTWAREGAGLVERTMCRTLDPSGLRIAFTVEPASPTGPTTSGEWTFRLLPGGRTEARLAQRVEPGPMHPFDTPASAAADAAAAAELGALERIASPSVPLGATLLTFADVVALEPWADAAAAYRFVAAADRWPEHLPHVERVELTQTPPSRPGAPLVQDMLMDTRTGDGARHATRSIRLCFPPERIVYTQLRPPALLRGHTGTWDFVDGGPGPARVVATHKVAIDTTRITELLGANTTLAEARTWLRATLGANSRTTLAAAARAAG